MKWLVVLTAVVVSSISIVCDIATASEPKDIRQLLIGVSKSLDATHSSQILNAPGTVDGKPVICQLMISKKASEGDFLSLDFSVDDKNIVSLDLGPEIQGLSYEGDQIDIEDARFEVISDSVNGNKLELAASFGHITDQVNGAQDYVWTFKKTSTTGFLFNFWYNWGDDDGGGGSLDYNCQF